MGSVLTLVLSSTGFVKAATLFDNLSTGIVGGVPVNTQSWAEDDFIVGGCVSTCKVDQVSLSLLLGAGSNPVNLGLQILGSDGVTSIGSLTMAAANNPGGSGLSANNLPSNFESGTSLFTPTSTINLSAGGTYWLRLTNLDPIPPLGESGDVIQWAYNSSSGSFNLNDAQEGLGEIPNASLLMKIEGSPAAVPIPAAAWLMGSALLGLVGSWRRKKA